MRYHSCAFSHEHETNLAHLNSLFENDLVSVGMYGYVFKRLNSVVGSKDGRRGKYLTLNITYV